MCNIWFDILLEITKKWLAIYIGSKRTETIKSVPYLFSLEGHPCLGICRELQLLFFFLLFFYLICMGPQYNYLVFGNFETDKVVNIFPDTLTKTEI